MVRKIISLHCKTGKTSDIFNYQLKQSTLTHPYGFGRTQTPQKKQHGIAQNRINANMLTASHFVSYQ